MDVNTLSAVLRSAPATRAGTALFLLLSVSCAGDGHGSEQLSAAVERTRDAGTAHVAFALQRPGDDELLGDGVVDLRADRGRLFFWIGQREPIEVRFDRGAGAFQFGERWWGYERGDLGFGSPVRLDLGLSDLPRFLAALEDATSVSAEPASPEGGTLFTAEVPVRRLSLRALEDRVVAGALADVTVATDGDGRIVRLVGAIDPAAFAASRAPGSARDLDSVPGEVTAVLTLSRFGVDVNVAMPEDVAPVQEFPSIRDRLGIPSTQDH